MGYSHYFAFKPDAPQYIEKWPQMTRDARKIIEHAVDKHHVAVGPGIEEGFTDDNGLVHDTWEANEQHIWLNGVGEEAHETLLILAPGVEAAKAVERAQRSFGDVDYLWAFCKTARKEYDGVVGAILLRCHVLAPEAFVISSDGGWNSDWKDDAQLDAPGPRTTYRECFGPEPRGKPFTDALAGPPAATKRMAHYS